jgi:glycosyltransferase involved in cell wall biosynthesis
MGSSRVLVFIPVYHGVFAMVEDVLDSLDAYLGCDFHVVIVDDHTTDGTARQLEGLVGRRSNVTVLRNDVNLGWGSGIFKNFARAALYGLEHLRFDVFLKLDHDSLLIAPGVGVQLRQLLGIPGVGLVGTIQPEVNRWMFDWRTQPSIKRAAVKHGYFKTSNGLFWSIQAGVMGFNRDCLSALRDRGWLERFDFVRFGTKGLVEDVMLPILCYAAGFEARDAPFVLSKYGSDNLLKVPYTIMRDIGLGVIHPLKRGASTFGRHNSSDHDEMRLHFQEVRQKDRA